MMLDGSTSHCVLCIFMNTFNRMKASFQLIIFVSCDRLNVQDKMAVLDFEILA